MGKSYKWKKAAVSYISCYAGIIHRGGNLCRCSAFKASSIFIAIHPTQTPSLSLQFLGLFNSQLSMTCCQNQLSYNWMGPCMHLEHLGCGTTQDISYGTMQQTRYSMVTEEGPTGSAKESKSGEDMPRNAVSADGENSHSPNILPQWHCSTSVLTQSQVNLIYRLFSNLQTLRKILPMEPTLPLEPKLRMPRQKAQTRFMKLNKDSSRDHIAIYKNK